jgi:hypothetical protein
VSNFNDDYKAQLLVAAQALFAPAAVEDRRRPRRSRRVSLFAAIALGVLLLAAAAFAATQLIGVGAPVRASRQQHRASSTGIGVPVSGVRSSHGSARRLSISVPDPAGGLPWGMRIVRTTRGLVCIQIGRLLDGKLGILGEDGEFGDDGLFHELPASVLDSGTCSEPSHYVLYDATALPAAAAMPGPHLSCWYPGTIRPAGADQPFCSVRDERDVVFGVLGPNAVSVTYRAHGGLHTVPVSGAHGAYLIVSPQTTLSTPQNGSLSSSSFPLGHFPIAYQPSVITALVFRINGRLCQTGTAPLVGGPPACTMSKHRPLPAGPVPHTKVALAAHEVAGGYDLDLQFAAPVAVRNADTAYAVEYTLPQNNGCGAKGTAGLPIERDLARGQLVRLTIFIGRQPGCHGTIHGHVIFGSQPDALSGPTYDETTIGRFSFTLP